MSNKNLTMERPILRSAMIQRPSPLTTPTTSTTKTSTTRTLKSCLDRPLSIISQKTTTPTTTTTTSLSTRDLYSTEERWNIQHRNNIPFLPLFFHLERTHIIIPKKKLENENNDNDNDNIMEIIQRILNCLDYHSIATSFDNEKAMASAETSDQVRFYIRLFRARKTTTNNNNDNESKQEQRQEEEENDDSGILVEVQRRSGSCPLFHAAAQAILSAAKGSSSSSSSSSPPSLDCFRRSRQSLPPPMTNQTDETDDEERRELTLRSLENITSLLQKDRLDANLLGMESLRHLTSMETSGVTSAYTAARALLLVKGTTTATDEEVVVAAHRSLRQFVISLIQHGRLHITDDDDNNDNNDDEEEEGEDDFEDEHETRIYSTMRSHALVALSNALTCLQKQSQKKNNATISKKHCQMIISNSWLHQDNNNNNDDNTMISILVHELKHVNQRPHDVCQVVKILGILIYLSDDDVHFLTNNNNHHLGGLSDLLGNLKQYSHAKLRYEVQNILMQC